MAGNGDRFRRAGYTVPKYMIEVKGRTLFTWALGSLENFIKDDTEVVFLARRDHNPKAFIEREARELGIRNMQVVLIDGVTDGQASSALLAGKHLRCPEAPCLIYNIDTHVEPDALRPADVRGDGWIPSFPGEGSGWSFVDAADDGEVSRVVEKVRISEHATVGLYWFSSFRLYAELYRTHFDTHGTEAGERYIAPMYNTLISTGGLVYNQPLPAGVVHPLGTPAEVQEFVESDYRGVLTC